MNAHLGFRLVEIKLSFPVLLGDRIIALNCHSSERTAVLRHPVPNYEIVTDIRNRQQDERNNEYTSHAFSP